VQLTFKDINQLNSSNFNFDNLPLFIVLVETKFSKGSYDFAEMRREVEFNQAGEVQVTDPPIVYLQIEHPFYDDIEYVRFYEDLGWACGEKYNTKYNSDLDGWSIIGWLDLPIAMDLEKFLKESKQK